MNSGIYKLTFKDGSIYIGKSIDIPKRWNQHNKALIKGTHTKQIQEAYNKYGAPEYTTIFECHPHHIDILETYFINGYWSPKILNATRPADLDPLGISLVDTLPESTWDLSTFECLEKWQNALAEIERLEKLIHNSKDATVLLSALANSKALVEEIHYIKNRGFWARVFNW